MIIYDDGDGHNDYDDNANKNEINATKRYLYISHE